MKSISRVVPLLLALAPGAALAQAEFNGTWKLDTKAAHLPAKPEVYLLKDGVYTCKTCTPPFQIKADGMAHPVAGSPYFDSAKLKVIDAHTVAGEHIKNGQTNGKVTETVSADGKTLTVRFDDMTVPSSPVTGTYTAVRLEPAPAGAHAISGAWRQTTMSDMSDNGLLNTFKVAGGMVSYSTPSGQSYQAKLDGTQAPYMGDPGTTTVSVTSSGPRELTETDYRNGKAATVAKMTVAPDGKAISVAVEDKLHNTTSSFTLVKQ